MDKSSLSEIVLGVFFPKTERGIKKCVAEVDYESLEISRMIVDGSEFMTKLYEIHQEIKDKFLYNYGKPILLHNLQKEGRSELAYPLHSKSESMSFGLKNSAKIALLTAPIYALISYLSSGSLFKDDNLHFGLVAAHAVTALMGGPFLAFGYDKMLSVSILKKLGRRLDQYKISRPKFDNGTPRLC